MQMTKPLDAEIEALLRQARQDYGNPAAVEICQRVELWMQSRDADDRYGMTLHRQRIETLLAQYRCPSCGS
jgi:hypothetical protein